MDVDAAFRRIQLNEARIEQADRALGSARADGSPEACAAACPAPESARAAAERVCDDAAAIEDADARVRCEQARTRSRGFSAPPACACTGGAP
jgi:hypothetical protein